MNPKGIQTPQAVENDEVAEDLVLIRQLNSLLASDKITWETRQRALEFVREGLGQDYGELNRDRRKRFRMPKTYKCSTP